MPSRASATPSTVLSVLLVIVAMASIQTGAAIAKRLFPVVGPLGAAALRILFATLILWAVMRPWRSRVPPAAWRPIIIYGVALGGMNSFFYAALDRIPLGIASAFEITGPLTVAVLTSRRAVDFVWIALAIAGLLVLLPLRQAAAGVDPVGAVFAFGAGSCWALYILFGQKAGAEHGVQTTAIGLVIAGICVLPFGAWQAGGRLFTPSIIPFAVAVAVLSTALPYSLEMIALGGLPARTFGTLMSLQPAFAAMSGLLLLHEHLAVPQWLAIAAIIVASAGTAGTAARRSSQAPLSTDPMVGADDALLAPAVPSRREGPAGGGTR